MLTYENYTNDRFAVRGDSKHQPALKALGARWNSRMRGGEGWLLPHSKETALKRLITSIRKAEKLERMELNSKFRKDQSKYRREESESEDVLYL